MNKFREWVSEMIFTPTWTGLRSVTRFVTGGFYPNRPLFDKTVIDYDMARQLYRNDGAEVQLGAGFCRPIIDRAVEFVGMPIVSSVDEAIDAEINDAIQKHWAPQLQEMMRNAMRDSKTWVRVWQPLITDPLTTDAEREACCLDIVDPERIQSVIYDPRNPKRIQQLTIINFVLFADEVQPDTDAPRGSKAQSKEHEVWEVVTPDRHRYYDRTDRLWLTEWEHSNPYGFVPFVEVFNEYDSALGGGQSDLESCYPFIKAFHEVLRASLQAHNYHSTPKLKFKVIDVIGFLKNNYPDTVDDDGNIIAGSAISWKGREVLFMGENEDIDFIEATSILGDSKILLEFLIDCIAIASETPEWAFMRVAAGTSEGAMNAQTTPFEKRIARKRIMFQDPIQVIVKMVLVMRNQDPERVDVTWQEIRPEVMAQMAQAIQQLVMSFEVMLERKLISDNTAREALRQFPIFRKMKPPLKEAQDAKSNVLLANLAPPALPAPKPKVKA